MEKSGKEQSRRPEETKSGIINKRLTTILQTQKEGWFFWVKLSSVK